MRSRVEHVDVRRFLLLVVASAIVVWTLAPLEFDPRAVGARLGEAVASGLTDGASEALAHFAAFLCLGVLLGNVLSNSRAAMALLVCFCLALESAQLFIPDRHARIADLVLNAVAGSLGLWLSGRTGSFPKRPAVVLKALLAAATVLWLGASIAPIAFLSLKSWHQDCTLVVGNELDNSEPWMGAISRLAIAPGVHDSVNAAGSSLLYYEFEDPPERLVRSQGSLSSSELDLMVRDSAAGSGKLVLTNSPLVTAGSAAKLARLLSSSGSFTIFVNVPAVYPSTNLAGRLLSLSSTSFARNFMLGREGNDLVFRVRNGVMEENGVRNILRARNVIDGSAMDLRAIYHRGVAALFKNGALVQSIDLRQNTVYLGLGSGSGAALSAGILLGVIAAFPAFCLLPIRELSAHVFAFGATALFSFLPYFAACGFKAPAALSFAGISTVAIGLAYLVAHWACSPKGGGLRFKAGLAGVVNRPWR